jgi:hypothetical protein
MGYSAACWPWRKPIGFPTNWRALRNWARYLLNGDFLRDFDTGPFSPPIAKRRDLRRAVVIYPEIVAGNPLAARKVVRWLLYHPGAHTGVVQYRSSDLVVAYNPAFVPDGAPATRILNVTFQIPVYLQWNYGERSGSCVLVRKGGNRCLDQHPPDATPVDDLGHKERADIFTRTQFCYSYDLYTYYSVYAALCGCTPIIVPKPGLSEQDWQPQEANRLGLAYGEAKIPWAEATRQQLQDNIVQRRRSQDATVEEFVRVTRDNVDL